MIARTLRGAFIRVRGHDWWSYKIPPLLAVAFAGLLVFGEPRSGLAPTAVALGTILAIAVYGFVLNDLTDIEADRASGQPNRMASVGPSGRALALGLPLVAAVLLEWRAGDAVMRTLTTANLLLPTLYSVPPVRLKARGIWGALVDATGVHALPMALVTWTVTREALADDPRAVAFLALAIGWAFLAGFRNIIVHQARGIHGDRLALVRTFIASIGAAAGRRLVWRFVFPAELMALAGLLGLILPAAPVLIPVLVVYALLELRAMRFGWTLAIFDPPGGSTERYRPIVNNALYEVWLPLGLGLQLALVHAWGWGVLVGIIALFYPNIASRINALRPLFHAMPAAPRDRPFYPRTPVDLSPLTNCRVFISCPAWVPDPINHWAADMARGLRHRGIDAVLLLTEEDTPLVTLDQPRMPIPPDVPMVTLQTGEQPDWGLQWAALHRLLSESAPCVHVVTNDWRQSGVIPTLPEDVTVVQVVHGTDEPYLEQVERLADALDLVIGGSPEVSALIRASVPALKARLVTIPHGILGPAPGALPVMPDEPIAVLLV